MYLKSTLNTRLSKIAISLISGFSVLGLVIFLLFLPVHADTAAINAIIVPTTWTTGSTHIITSSLSIQSKLIIQPGTEVRFAEGADIQVSSNGILEAIALPAQPITFTSNQTQARGFWNGIHFDGNSISGTIQYAIIEYANVGLELIPSITSSVSPRFNVMSNTIRYIGNIVSPANSGAIIGSPDNALLNNNFIFSATRGIVLQKPGSIQIAGNTIFNIDDGCVVFESTTSGSVNNLIENNTIFNCGGNGIRIDDLAGTGNKILSNVISNTVNGAIYLNNQNGLVITNNVVYDIPLTGGSGLVFNWSQGFSATTMLYNNTFCVAGKYEIDASGSNQTLIANGNWLGTNTPAIGSEITGTVNYTPNIQLSVSASPATLPADGTSTTVLTITMNDGAGHSIPANFRDINLNASMGTLSASSVTLDANGVATVTFTAPNTYGTAIISATELCNFTSLGNVEIQATDLSISKIANSPTIQPGNTLTYTLAFTNVGNFTATGVIITETLPANTIFSGPVTWSMVTTNSYTYTISDISPGAGGNVNFIVQMNGTPSGTIVITNVASSGITNVVSIGTSNLETNLSNNIFTLFTPLKPYQIYLPLIMKNLGGTLVLPTPTPTPTPLPLPQVSDVVLDPNTNQVFVASPRQDGVHVINGNTNTVERTVWVGNGPTGLAVLTATTQITDDKVFVAHAYGNNSWHPGVKAFGVFDTVSHNTFDTGYVGAGPVKIAANNNLGRIYVSNLYDKFAVLNGRSASPEARLGWVGQKNYGGAYGVAVSHNTNRIYLATRDSGKLVVFDGNADRLLQIGYIPTHITPPENCALYQVAVNPNTGHVFVTCPSLGKIFVLDEAQSTILKLSTLGTLKYGDKGWMRIVSANAAPWLSTITVPGGIGLGQEGIDIDPVTNLVFITHADQNRVYVLQDGNNGSLLLPPVTLSGGFNSPQGIAVNPNTHYVYVGNAGNNTLSVITGTAPFSSVATINLP